MKLKLKEKQDPEYLKSNNASLETSYGFRIEEKLKIAAIVKAGGKQFSRHSQQMQSNQKGWW